MKPAILIFLFGSATVFLAAEPVPTGSHPERLPGAKPPNIVFFVLDDMNDWVHSLGYPQAITPNMDQLAAAGVSFTNAHTAGVFCAPSRTALFTGRHASTTGCYTTQVFFRDHPDIRPLQSVLHDSGYKTLGAGKLFHHPAGYVDLRSWEEFFVRDPAQKTRGWPLDSWSSDLDFLPDPFPYSAFSRDGEKFPGLFLEWGPIKDEDEGKMADTIRTKWACDHLGRRHDKPFFLAVGLYTPHFPNYAPRKYFDLYDRDKIELPPYNERDLEDLPPAVRKAKETRAAHHRKLERLGAVKDAIHGYLACVSYADAMLGRVLDAIESGPNAGDTIVILWSDHGYHHGEKFDWGKHTLWERTSNVPFLFAGPGIAKGARVDTTVSLIDLFPTVIDLAGAKDEQPRDGISLAPMLKDPAVARDREVLLPGMKPEEYAIINRDWRYIRYADGGEELYDVRKDPNEWTNLASLPEYSAVKERLRAKAPAAFAKPGPEVNQLRLVIEGECFHWENKPVKEIAPRGKAKQPKNQRDKPR
jgi:arylsulfatase A-like enzyme